jgi:hypothetical protein
MKEDDGGIFRKESIEKISTPEQLSTYLMVTRSSWWVIVSALVVALVSFVVWANTGTIPETVDAQGMVVNGWSVDCYLPSDSIKEDLVGKKVVISKMNSLGTQVNGVISSVSYTPYSKKEITQLVGSEWVVDNLITDPYMYRLIINTDQMLETQPKAIVDVSVIVSETKPISYLLR